MYWVLLRGSQQSIDFESSVTISTTEDSASADQPPRQTSNQNVDHQGSEESEESPSSGNDSKIQDKGNSENVDCSSMVAGVVDTSHCQNEDHHEGGLSTVRASSDDFNQDGELPQAASYIKEPKESLELMNPGDYLDRSNMEISYDTSSALPNGCVRNYPDFAIDHSDLIRLHGIIDLELHVHRKTERIPKSAIMREYLGLDLVDTPENLELQHRIPENDVEYIMMEPNDRKPIDEYKASKKRRRELVLASKNCRPDGFEWLKDFDADPRKRTDWVDFDLIEQVPCEGTFHHRNILSRGVGSKHQTVPQISASVFFTEKARYDSGYRRPDPCSHQAVVTAQAWKWVDAFAWSSELPHPRTLELINSGELTGTALEVELTGCIEVVHSYEGWWLDDHYDMDDVPPLCPDQVGNSPICFFHGSDKQAWLYPFFPYNLTAEDSRVTAHGTRCVTMRLPGTSPLRLMANINGEQSGLDDFVSQNSDHNIAQRIKAFGTELYQKEWQDLRFTTRVAEDDQVSSMSDFDEEIRASHDEAAHRIRIVSDSTNSTSATSPIFEELGATVSPDTSEDGAEMRLEKSTTDTSLRGLREDRDKSRELNDCRTNDNNDNDDDDDDEPIISYHNFSLLTVPSVSNILDASNDEADDISHHRLHPSARPMMSGALEVSDDEADKISLNRNYQEPWLDDVDGWVTLKANDEARKKRLELVPAGKSQDSITIKIGSVYREFLRLVFNRLILPATKIMQSVIRNLKALFDTAVLKRIIVSKELFDRKEKVIDSVIAYCDNKLKPEEPTCTPSAQTCSDQVQILSKNRKPLILPDFAGDALDREMDEDYSDPASDMVPIANSTLQDIYSSTKSGLLKPCLGWVANRYPVRLGVKGVGLGIKIFSMPPGLGCLDFDL